MKTIFLFCTLLILKNLQSQQKQFYEFYELRNYYVNFLGNDFRAFHLISNVTENSKKQKANNLLPKPFEEDDVYFSSSSSDKLKHADKTIQQALQSEDRDLISYAYLEKGIIYYGNYKNYRSALDCYLKAYQYSENSKDDYLKHEIIHQLGVMKSDIGYYDSAMELLEKANQFFCTVIQNKPNHNSICNYKKGYYNTLHRMIVCQRNMKNYKSLNASIKIGLSNTKNNPVYYQEYGYFLKEKGIEEFRKKQFNLAISSLKESQKVLLKIEDFAWVTVNYFYIGKSYLTNNKPEQAVPYFKKVDSIFQKHNFLFPELRENYELLIQHYKNQKHTDQELYYTKKLAQAERISTKDFAYLSSNIHRKFDTKILQDKMNNTYSIRAWILGILSLATITMISFFVIKDQINKKANLNYKILEEKIFYNIYALAQKKIITEVHTHKAHTEKCQIKENVLDNLLCKLKSFEDNNEFIENGLTLNKLAHKLQTNSSYLSQVINDRKGMNFNRYLGELRINYITQKLYTDKLFLNYKIEALAEKCGIASRTNFSNLFQEINGMRPTEFIKKRQEYVKKNADDVSTKDSKLLPSAKKIIL